MTTLQRDDLSPIQDFLQWRDAQTTGRQGTQGAQNDRRSKYIPYSALETYMRKPNTVEKLLGALFPDGHDAPDADSIRNHWLRSFAILISINHGQMIDAFRRRDDLEDEKLPLRREPENFPKSSIVNGTGPMNLWNLFYKRQWEFCPKKLEFNMDSDLDENYILPFQVGDKLGRGGSSDVCKITVDAEYNMLSPPVHDNTASSALPTNVFVIKTFRGREAEDIYNTERKAFIQLRYANKSPSNIVGYHGAFVRSKTFHIILEYANLGNLEDFMRRTPSLILGEDILLLWERLCGLFYGVHSIHGKGRMDFGPRVMLGWHQDLRPANILVRRRPGNTIYDCDFLIADLGLSHFKSPTPSQPIATDRDTFGTNVYGAPETHRVNGVNDQLEMNVGQGVDVWSLGCILSEMATWIVLGMTSVEEYQRRRQIEASQPEKLGPRKGPLFHDGRTVLDTVRESHDNLANHRRIDDFVTVDIVENLIVEMLSEESHRAPARYLASRSSRIIENSRKKLEGWKSATDSAISSPHLSNKAVNEFLPMGPIGLPMSHIVAKRGIPASLRYAVSEQPNTGFTCASPSPNGDLHLPPKSPPRQPQLSVNQVLEWKKKRLPILRDELPHKNLLTDIKNRDHVFLIDNSVGMSVFRKEAEMVIKAIGYMVKNSDPDGMDMLFTQSEKEVRKSKNTKSLVKTLKAVDFYGLSDMRSRLAAITEAYKNNVVSKRSSLLSIFRTKSSRLRRLSLYILTDGDWQPGCDLKPTIQSLVKKLDEHDLREGQVAIQFIRFGNRPESILELERLDSGLELALDIVDTTPSDGNVLKMLLGGMNPWFDGDKRCETPNDARSSPHPGTAPPPS